jgi:hypothetical protein
MLQPLPPVNFIVHLFSFSEILLVNIMMPLGFELKFDFLIIYSFSILDQPRQGYSLQYI